MEYLPELYVTFQRLFPEVQEAYHELSRRIYERGPLDQKTGHLIKLGVAIGMNSEGAVRSHARRAMQEGAAPDEILQAVLLSFTTCGFPFMSAALKWVEEVLEKEGRP
jgi:alkylhydroperoxidase/carboxymuconolactone decarboxylase family protein YurZ